MLDPKVITKNGDVKNAENSHFWVQSYEKKTIWMWIWVVFFIFIRWPHILAREQYHQFLTISSGFGE